MSSPTLEPAAEPVEARLPAEARRRGRARADPGLPKEMGVMLVAVGSLGWLLPGMVGTPALIAGGLVLWPKAFGKVETWFQRDIRNCITKA